MNKSPEIGELAQALSKAQAQMEGAKKKSDNPFFKSKYADLAEVWDSIRGPLTANGLSVMQCPWPSDDSVILETILSHSSGQWVSSVIQMKPVKNDPQGLGSCLTYCRRYSLAAIVGIAQEDDDGEKAMGRKASKQQEGSPDPRTTGPQPYQQAVNQDDINKWDASRTRAFCSTQAAQLGLDSKAFKAKRLELFPERTNANDMTLDELHEFAYMLMMDVEKKIEQGQLV